jgi:scyllo-inositol 2-dehydrogenase (NADP+)
VEPSADRVWERAGEHDIAVIATANDSHVPLAGAAIDAGLAVVVDKPLAPSVARAMELVERADAAGVALTVFHNRRWDSDFLTLKRLIAAGELGRVHRFESRFERWRPVAPEGAWRFEADRAAGGGVLLDLGTHLADQAIQLFGPVADAHGEVRHVRGTPADDDAYLELRHHSGVTSHLWMSEVAADRGPRLRVLGSGGAFVSDHLDGQEEALRTGRRPGDGDGEWGTEPPERRPRLVRGDESQPVEPTPGAWPEFYRRLAAALSGDGDLPVDPRDAVEVLRVLESAV